MITAVDTSVLLDVFTADPAFGPASRDTLGTCLAVGTVLVCSAVWAETSAFFPEPDSAGAAMTTLGAAFNSLEQRSADLAGEAWRSYRKRGLLTRDRGFYRSYFPDLTVIEPTIG